MDDFQKRLAFFKESDRMKYVIRRTYTGDRSRRENDAEHSFSLALLAILMEPYAPENVDMERVLRMAILHDLIEIYAGDTYVYDADALSTKETRETRAAKKLYGLLPEQQGAAMESLWREFDAAQTPSARFCAMLDRFQPLYMNYETGGKSWKEHGVRASDVRARFRGMRGEFERFYQCCEDMVSQAVENGWLKDA